MIRAIIFDCFGVLVNDALSAMVDELKVTEPEKAQQIIDTIAAANKGIITAEVSRDMVAGIFNITTDEYISRVRSGEAKNQQLLDYIPGLRPRYKTALLSNTSTRGIEVRFTPEELSACFDAVVVSGVIGYAKPEAQAYEITAERLGVRLNECVMIDDREDYCAGAIGVGMQAIRYESFDQLKRELSAVLEPERR